MPLGVLVLGFGIVAQGTSELMLTGLLPDMAADLGVTVARAGARGSRRPAAEPCRVVGGA